MTTNTKFIPIAVIAAIGLAGCFSDGPTGAEPEFSAAVTSTPGDPSADETSPIPDAVDPSEDGGGATPVGGSGSICEVTDVGGIADEGFNQLTFEGIERAAGEFGLSAEILGSATDDDYALHLQTFVDRECLLIVTIGARLSNATAEFATANIDQQFAIIDFDYEDAIDNVLNVNFNSAEPAFLAGYLAAGMTGTGRVGTFGGIRIPAVTTSMNGFANGVAYHNAQNGGSVEVIGWDGADGAFVGNFDNLADGEMMASSFAEEGVDIVFPVAGRVGLGSADYAVQAGGLRIIGVDTDLYEFDVERASVYLTSVLKNVDVAVFAAAERVIVNGEPGGSYEGTLENGGVSLAPFHDLEDEVPDELKRELEDLAAEVIAGNVSVG